MKRILLIALVALFASSVSATDMLTARLTHTIVAADTVALAAWEETVRTPKFDISKWCTLGFYWNLRAGPDNVAGAGSYDSVDVNLEISHDGFTDWKTYLLDSSAIAADSGRTALHFVCADSVIGNWLRGVLRYRDSTLADAPDSLGVIRQLDFELYLLGRH